MFVAWRGTKDSPTVAQLMGEEQKNPHALESQLSQLVEGPQASLEALDVALQNQRGAP